MSEHVPVKALAGPLEDAVDGLAWCGRGRKHQRTGQRSCRTDCAGRKQQVAVTGEHAYVVTVLVEGVLPAPLPDDAQQRELARMHVRVAVVGLMGILHRVIRIHVIGHRAPIDHVVGGQVGLGGHSIHVARAAGAGAVHDFLCGAVDPGIDLGKLKQVLAVVAAVVMVKGRVGKPEIGLARVGSSQRVAARAGGGQPGRAYGGRA